MTIIKSLIKMILLALFVFIGTEQTYALEEEIPSFIQGDKIDSSYFVIDCSDAISQNEEVELAQLGYKLFDKSNIRVTLMTLSSDEENIQSNILSCASQHEDRWSVNEKIDKNSIYLLLNETKEGNILYVTAENSDLNSYYNNEGGLDNIVSNINRNRPTTNEMAKSFYKQVVKEFEVVLNSKEVENTDKKEVKNPNNKEVIEEFDDIITGLLSAGAILVGVVGLTLLIIFISKRSDIEFSTTSTEERYDKDNEVKIVKTTHVTRNFSLFPDRKIRKSILNFEDIRMDLDDSYSNLTSPLINKIEKIDGDFPLLLKNTFNQEIKLDYNEKDLVLLSSETTDNDTLYLFKIISKNNRTTIRAVDTKFKRTATKQLEFIKPVLMVTNDTSYSVPVGQEIVIDLNTDDAETTVVSSSNRNIEFELIENNTIKINSLVAAKGRITIQNRAYTGRIVINTVFIDEK